ncbi:unnamed protein product [Adineta steineri]|uniref:NAD(P)(+)--arginine ADP-ribosyltransferase n=1 Tax=Adineta steineri TaxID=433720 RepID=A0A819RPK9_9BILA|nr:unnamed protein product [Adineta steineri]CAF4049627.1 unnamed protein product [Adineta steineri]
MNPADKLTQDESASIHLYTMEWEEHDNSLYMKLNQTLRSVDRSKLIPWFKYLKFFLTAFFKLPPSKDTLVWRGAREDLSALYPKGREFAWWAFSSCSTSIDVLESPNYLGKSGTRTIFSIQTNSGKLICAHSYFDNEDEILLPPGIYLKVVDSLNPADGLHIIHLQEIEPPHKMLADPFDLSDLEQASAPTKPPSYMVNPEKEEEYTSSTSVISEPSVQPPLKKKKLTIEAPEKQPPYSDWKLRCNGRASTRCGGCCDWYWGLDGNRKVYKKRDDARCFYHYIGRGHFGYGNIHICSRIYAFDGDLPLCTCNDNYFQGEKHYYLDKR